jgi:uncharacterized protein (TIGR02646 family)
LYAEQSGKCAYCERKLESDLADTKIEHFHPRNEATGLSWNGTCGSRTKVSRGRWDFIEISIGNLLLCCLGGEGLGQDNFTCDTSKGNQHICEDFYNPKGIVADALVRIAADGRALAFFYPGSGPDEAQATVDDTFRLNVRTLQEHRRKIFAAHLNAFTKMKANNQGRTPARALREKSAQKLREASRMTEFGSTLLSVAASIENGGQ